jgi:glycosyltransferase involved in cell wall biosynthesis
MPSKSEGLGSAVLEAYQHGVPVVTSDVGGLPEIVNEGVTGYQFKLGDMGAAEDRVVALSTDKVLYARLVSQVNEGKGKYSPENMAQSYIECYQECLLTKS